MVEHVLKIVAQAKASAALRAIPRLDEINAQVRVEMLAKRWEGVLRRLAEAGD